MKAADREAASQLLERASCGDEAAFARLVDPYRRALHVHCYRDRRLGPGRRRPAPADAVGSVARLGRFEGRATLRLALRIATNRCLNALRDRGRRLPLLPESPPEAPEPPDPSRLRKPVWLEPYPDALLEDVVDQTYEPGARYEAREAIGLAFVAGLQRLLPRQRAVLVLRDALGFRAREVAEVLGTSASVMSALHRARIALEAELPSRGSGRH